MEINAAAITRFIWLTEDMAISDFRSVWRRQSRAVIKTPIIAIIIIGRVLLKKTLGKTRDVRKMP